MSAATIEMEATAARLAADVEDGHFCTGAQAYVSRNGRVLLDAAFGSDGLGRPMGTGTYSAVYCAIKPMITVLVLLAERDGLLRLDATLGEVLPLGDNPELGAVRLDDLLSHRAGMHLLRSIETGALPPAVSHRLAMEARPAPGWDRRRHGAYSEWLGFYLVGQVLEQVSGEKLTVLLRRRLLEPLGIDEVALGWPSGELEAIGVNVRLQAGTPLPLLMERTPWFAAAADPSLGAYATMRGLGRFYEWVLATLEGSEAGPLDPELLRHACRPHRAVVQDPILGIEADWGLGFMTGLRRLGFGPYVSPRAVGHTGQVGTSMAFCDPDHGLAAAVLYNGVIDQATGVKIRRPAIVGAIYRDLGVAPSASDRRAGDHERVA